MTAIKLSSGLCVLALLLSSCAPPAPQLPPSSATSAPTSLPLPPAPSPSPALLTDAMLRNMEYVLPVAQKTVRFVEGRYESGAEANYLSAQILEPIALGDLNSDGQDDAAIVLAEKGGGTGTFVALFAALNQAGQPQLQPAVALGDRPHIKGLMIRDRRIIVEAIVHDVDDPMCCPTFPITSTYQLRSGVLKLTRLDSQTPVGTIRAIRIEHPTPETAMGGQVFVSGTVTIAPFENNLMYRLEDAAGNELTVGPLQVTAETMGGPGTFTATLDVFAFPTAGRLTILDLSAADGSTLALDSVELQTK